MSLRYSQRGGRRRRVLSEEKPTDPPVQHRVFRGPEEGPVNPYTEAALQSLHISVVDVFAVRPLTICLWFLVGLLPIIGVVVLDAQATGWARSVPSSHLHAFHLASSGNLASWLSSMFFALAAVVMLGIYCVRKHRRDDYRARFTVWQWGIAAAVFLSVDATAGLRHAWQGGCQALFPTVPAGDGSLWWIGTWSLLLGGLLVRLMVEMGRSRPSLAAAASAACLYVTAAMFHFWLAALLPFKMGQTLPAVAVLIANYGVLLTTVLYGRHVVFEAMGTLETASMKALPRRSRQRAGRPSSSATDRPRLRTVAADPNDAAATDSVSSSQGDKQERDARAQQAKAENHTVDTSLDGPHGPEGGEARPLSKAERKRLRREKRRRAA